MNETERLDDHQKFKELAALAHRGTLSEGERLTLESHLRVCASCQQAYEEYTLISTEGMQFLAAAHGYGHDLEAWDDLPARNKLMARIRRAERANSKSPGELINIRRGLVTANATGQWVTAALAACLLVAVALGAYHLGGRRSLAQQRPVSAASVGLQDLTLEKKPSDSLVVSMKAELARLQTQVLNSRQEIARLEEALRVAEDRFAALSAANTDREEQFRQVLEQRDKLASQLRGSEQSYQLLQTELTTLRAEHDRVLLRTASLQSKIDDLTASGRDQERRLIDDEQFLASDRDIRELMGARKLYIADVFDVDSGSRTRKPFGRVFYTQNKSLIFYAFDLDRQPGVKNASAFQVWGQRDTESGGQNHAMNLGILYMDSESNRRWVLRFDDPKQLAEIDAVFVTVEPHGGSQKPTGKPFLYALLRREANHP